MPLSPSRVVTDEYPMRRVLAASPHCTVYESVRPDDGGPVAVKLINSGGSAEPQHGRQRFTRAMAAIQFLRPTGFPELHDFGFTPDDGAFMVMELVDGRSLGALAGASPRRALAALLQVVETLEELARGDVHHNNLSPDNVVVTTGPAGDQVKIVGYGTAAFLEEGRRGALLGHSPDSDRFTAPERFDADREPVDSKSDLYSLALVACELLGAEVKGLGGADPTVGLPTAVRDRLGDTAELEQILAVALRADPARRELDHTVLRAVLLTVLEGAPEEPDEELPEALDELEQAPLPLTAADDEDDLAAAVPDDTREDAAGDGSGDDEAHGGFDPNKTDPALDPSALQPPEVPLPTASERAETGSVDGMAPPEVAPPGLADLGRRAVEATAPMPLPEPPAAEPAPPPPPRPHAGGRRLPYALAAVGAVAVLLLFQLVVGAVRRSPAPPVTVPAPVAVEIAPTEPPLPTPAPTAAAPRLNLLLEEAHRLMAENDREGAAAALEGLSDDEIDAFDETEQAIYDELLAMLGGGDRAGAIADLRGGLQMGSIRMLRRGVAGLSEMGAAELKAEPGLSEELARGREALRLHAAMWQAHDAGDNSAVLETAAAMIAILPEYSTPYQFRDQAAQALEAQAEGAAAAGHFDVALGLLEPVEQDYPEREGLEKRLAGYRRQQAAQAQLAPLIEAALAKGEAGQPEAGLAMLAGREAVPGLEDRLEAARADLAERFAAQDRQPPQVALPAGVELTYKKNQTVEVPLEVSDDYRVVKVRAMVRPEGATDYQELPLEPAGDGRYVVKIPPALHDNGEIALYVEADDSHGHAGLLGSPSEPLVIDRKGFFKRIFGG